MFKNVCKFFPKLFKCLKLLKNYFLLESPFSLQNYLKAQHLVEPREWDLFLKFLKKKLPLTIRIDQDYFNQFLLLKAFFKNETSIQYFYSAKEESRIKDEKFFPKVKMLDWYPNQLVYQIDKEEEISPEFAYFLKTERYAGGLFTQETASLIPVLLMDLKPDHKVLDMCASPGSKSTQILQMFIKNEPNRKGFLIANDISHKRVKILVTQSKKYFNPSLIITKCNASNFPELFDFKGENIYFDRILCDTPCSGSGTIRKHNNIFKDWSPKYSYKFHLKQLKIVERAVYLLKKNGLIIYSTCSFDPIENEAVISALLSKFNGSLELVDINQHPHKLASFKFSKGLTSWKVMLSNGSLVSSYDQVPTEDKDRIFETMFSKLDNHNLHLERCVRILPHLQNTGAFFIAVIKKNDNFKFIKQLNSIKRKSFKKMQPINHIKPDDPDWLRIKNYYQINNEFSESQLYYRSVGKQKTHIYLVNKSIQNLICSNNDKLNYYNCGVKVFSKLTKSDPGFRLSQEGLPGIMPFISKNKIIEINQMQLESILLKKKAHDLVKKLYPNDGCYLMLFKFKLNQNQTIYIPFSAAIFKNNIIPFVNFNQKLHILRICGLTKLRKEQ